MGRCGVALAKVFYPREFVHVPASCPPHPKGTEYKVAYGEEDWDGIFVPVFKVQMVYDGTVSGRKSPSFPVGTDDYLRVHAEMMNLYNKYTNK
jgi:hypothetical protein